MKIRMLESLRLALLATGCVVITTGLALAADPLPPPGPVATERAPASVEPPAPTSVPAPAEEIEKYDRDDRRAGRCPHPLVINMVAANGSGTPFLPDFPPGAAPITAGLNETAPDKHFGYTFTVKPPGKCCECTNATLTVWYKALMDGSSLTSSDSGNDGGGIVSGGTGVSTGAIWGPSGVVKKGQTKRIVYNVPCKVIATGHVSLYVQDDTAVERAVLAIRGCCVDANMPAQ